MLSRNYKLHNDASANNYFNTMTGPGEVRGQNGTNIQIIMQSALNKQNQ